MIYYDPMYLTEKGGAAGPPQWMYFTYVELFRTPTKGLNGGWENLGGLRDCLSIRALMPSTGEQITLVYAGGSPTYNATKQASPEDWNGGSARRNV